MLCLVCHLVTTRKTTCPGMGGKTPLSSKTRKKQSQQRASRSHKQQKPPLPPLGNAAAQPAARPWTWAPQRTTQETRAPKRRCSGFWFVCLFLDILMCSHITLLHTVYSQQYGSLQVAVSPTCSWSTLQPVRAQQQVTENCLLRNNYENSRLWLRFIFGHSC